jgi:glycine/D-amino acid oxidase-like deaminating enzyme
MTVADAVVLGQGLAGTAVAWALRWRGLRVVVLDREADDTASRVAAGLMTPITGRRLAKTWRLDDLWPAAQAFYRRAEAELGARFFHPAPSLRLFADPAEAAAYENRATNHFPELVGPLDPPIDPATFAAPFGGFQMTPAARLDVATYLDASRRYFARDGGYLAADVNPGRDVELVPDGTCLIRLGIRARWLVFCQGFDVTSNPWFPEVHFLPVQGEVLALRVPGLTESRVVHRGVWLAPQGDAYLAGSTYDRDRLDGIPTARGRDEVCSRLRKFLRLPFDVTGHRAAVRPVVAGNKPALGVHRQYPQLAYLNGLGSKGALQAPYIADLLASRLVSDR